MVTSAREKIDVRELVDRRLEELLAQEMRRLAFLGDADREVVGRYLAEFVRGGGKRLRPSFVYWGYRAAGGPEEDLDAVLPAACAVEILHASALILDDVMDEAGTRRGRTTAHTGLTAHHRGRGWSGDAGRFGDSAATLLGMLAFTWADAALLHGTRRLREAMEVFTTLRVEVISGQYLDVASAARGAAGREETTVIARYKSGKYTVERPLHLGHAVAGGDPALRAALSAYALPVGEAFQLRDDVLGVFGDPAVTGKPAGADLRQGKQTYLTAVARERAGTYGAAVLAAARDDSGVAAARELIVSTGALETAERRIETLLDTARNALVRAAVPPDAEAALLELAGLATARSA
ncbi:geranylgeranyl pyrophosphate synthase [Sphaerisporangium siamense]|uniref:Geranylgeranyl diphosphate synthase type I n=1 Tax=Sphaerisporangium siamense TaxID=795645 RepID=A0A7W7GD33_9ACTN|nr:polyprenyl synthetase family protein [Sphaerisporangium siamense]MBB4705187.1 geranylgeranyl diphosphate synthase type I [Sphaerisporangium siamense]GII83995.1 geranylgeranyl pyrophosphate synthase [Sphaerisporangium siamense]